MAAGSVELAEAIASHCRRVAGDKVRVVAYYSPSEHCIVYSREDVTRQLDMDEKTRSMFRTPFAQVNATVTRISRLSPTLDPPESVMTEFGDVVALMLPIRADEGIFVTFDSPGDLIDEILTMCKELVRESN